MKFFKNSDRNSSRKSRRLRQLLILIHFFFTKHLYGKICFPSFLLYYRNLEIILRGSTVWPQETCLVSSKGRRTSRYYYTCHRGQRMYIFGLCTSKSLWKSWGRSLRRPKRKWPRLSQWFGVQKSGRAQKFVTLESRVSKYVADRSMKMKVTNSRVPSGRIYGVGGQRGLSFTPK